MSAIIDSLLAWLKQHNPTYDNIFYPQDGAPVPPGDTFVVPSGELITALECKPEIIVPTSTLRTVNTAMLRIRNGPSLNSPELWQAPRGTKFLVESDTAQGDWVVVRLWVNKKYLT